MGVVNVTPDSFSDGGRFLDQDAAVRHALALIDDGADMLDIGGESTRPGADPVPSAEEIARVVPVVEAVRRHSDVTISVDTMKPQVMRAAHAAGADMWNDVTALTWSKDSLAVAAALGCHVVLMHMQGEPQTMQDDPAYSDVVVEVAAYLQGRARAAMAAGVAQDKIWLDPGIGFGKTPDHNLTLLGHLGSVTGLGFKTVLGVSRKRFIRAVDARGVRPEDRLGGSIAGAVIGADAGVDAIRAHDVRETLQALKLWAAVRSAL
ncbi:MAG TPA: dihydropteroate synthase [Caulobacteraceae bacterium]|nr:dihydropteroate synthase [Caulobacteraceae bacterium]